MIAVPVVLDTDTLSAVIRQNPLVLPKAEQYLADYGQFTCSLITRYEVLRGFKARNATSRLVVFEQFCAVNMILPITDEIIVTAAEIYADLHVRGELIGDADILIAASALVHGLAVATNNEKHFGRVRQLQIVNWLKK